MGPRVSPNGRLLAFVAMVDGQSQVAVMNPDSGDWTALTHDRTNGTVHSVCWSRNGDRIFFDRLLTTTPRGVYSVPALGGDEQLVLEDAFQPEVLPDGSLLLVRLNAERRLQFHHLWPATGRLEPLPAETDLSYPGGTRVFPDGKEAAFFGRPITSSQPQPPWHYYAIDLASGQARPLASSLPHPFGTLTISPKGDSVLLGSRSGDMAKVIEFPRDGKGSGRTLLDLKSGFVRPISSLEMLVDGSIYLDEWERPTDILRFAFTGGPPETVASVPRGVGTTRGGGTTAIQISDGRILFLSGHAGRLRLLVARPGKDPVPFVQTEEETQEAVRLGENEVALVARQVGEEGPFNLVVASAADGRIVRRLGATHGATQGPPLANLAASPDAKTLYYSASGSIWAFPVAGGVPRKLAAGDSVAADSNGRDLIVMRSERDAVHLFRVPLSGGAEQPIPLRSTLLIRGPLCANAVGKDGRILVDGETPDSWFDEVGILDPRTGKVEILAIPYSGDIWFPGWTPDGHILAVGARMQAGLWRYRPETK
jgi:hypothetical protein